MVDVGNIFCQMVLIGIKFKKDENNIFSAD